jgi:hypothetical protein
MLSNPGAATLAASFAGQALQREAMKNGQKTMTSSSNSRSNVEQRADLQGEAIEKGHVIESALPPSASGKVNLRA